VFPTQFLINMMLNVAIFSALFAVSLGKAPMSHGHDDVHMTVSSDFITEGFTKSLQANCTHVHDPSSDDVTASLTLSKSEDGSSYVNMAVLTFASPDLVKINDDLGADVTGTLNTAGTSYIAYEWKYPESVVEGTFKCSVNVLHPLGHSLVSSATKTIGQKTVNIQEVLDSLKHLDIQQEKMTQDLHNTTDQLGKTRDQLDKTTSQLGKTSDELKKTEVKLNQKLTDQFTRFNPIKLIIDNYLDSIFFATSRYNGHTYVLSHHMLHDVYRFNYLCQLKGGYLVEIDNQSEFNHVLNFFKSNNSPQRHLSIGITDIHHQGTWKYINSKKSLTFTRWDSGQPSSSNGYDCAYLNYGDNEMYAVYCADTNYFRFMCEIAN